MLDTYDAARRKIRQAEDTSSLDTDVELEKPRHHKRKTFDDVDSLVTRPKKYNKKQLMPLPPPPSRHHLML